MRTVDRELADVLTEVRNALTLSATAMRELKYTKILDSGTRVFNSAGIIELSQFSVPFASVAAWSYSGQRITISNQPPAFSAPTQGPGVKILNAYGMGVFNMVGRSLTFYGNPGDAVTYEVSAVPQPPSAMAGALQFISANVGVSGTVTAQTPATADIYTESPTSRLTNGNTATLTWPANVTDAFVGINVTGFAGGTNVIISVQQQDANGVWQFIGSTAAITAVGTATLSVGPGTNGALLRSGGSYRLSWAVTGTFTTLNIQLGVTAR